MPACVKRHGHEGKFVELLEVVDWIFADKTGVFGSGWKVRFSHCFLSFLLESVFDLRAIARQRLCFRGDYGHNKGERSRANIVLLDDNA